MKYHIPKVILDVECYANYFEVGFYNCETGNTVLLEMFDDQYLDFDMVHRVLTRSRTMGFNSLHYDVPMLMLALSLGKKHSPAETCRRLKKASDQIIQGGLKSWEFYQAFGIDRPRINHVDLFEVAPGMASLKIYGGRIHTEEMQDLPFPHDAVLTRAEQIEVRNYNGKDLRSTAKLRKKLYPQLELRCSMSEQYGQDLRSKSDAQIAEAVIVTEIQRITGVKPGKTKYPPGTSFNYRVPDFISYRTPVMKQALDVVSKAKFVIKRNGQVDIPDALTDLKIKIGNSVYRMGNGGLHSSEECAAHHADADHILVDRDVASYYPFIILGQQLYPQHMGRPFLTVYKSIVDRRIAAKRAGDTVTADSLKITINGSFGKFGSPYSALYSPHLMIQVTLTGQLALLMLIERLEQAGIPVVSANTDGIVIRCPKRLQDLMLSIIKDWETATTFETEETRYASLYSRDVNNYVAIYAKPKENKDGTLTYAKTKGAYADPGLMKNPANQISIRAAVDFITQGVPVEATIRRCKDIREFVTIRQVKGGAIKGKTDFNADAKKGEMIDAVRAAGWISIRTENPPVAAKAWVPRSTWEHTAGFCEDEALDLKSAYKKVCEIRDAVYLGKAIRWYYAKGVEGAIHYQLNGNTVARTEGAKPCMDLPATFPADVDLRWYIDEARSILADIGWQPRKTEDLDLEVEALI